MGAVKSGSFFDSFSSWPREGGFLPLEFSKIPRNADHAVSEGPGFPVDFRRDAGRITPVDMVRTGEDKIESAGFGKNHGDKFLILRMNESKNHDSQPDERVASIGQRTVKGKND